MDDLDDGATLGSNHQMPPQARLGDKALITADAHGCVAIILTPRAAPLWPVPPT